MNSALAVAHVPGLREDFLATFEPCQRCLRLLIACACGAEAFEVTDHATYWEQRYRLLGERGAARLVGRGPDEAESDTARLRALLGGVVGMLPGALVLDYGAGPGRLMPAYMGREVRGYDPSPTACALAREAGHDVRTTLPEPGWADVAVAALVLYGIPEYVEAVREIVSRVRVGGHVVVYENTTQAQGGPFGAFRDQDEYVVALMQAECDVLGVIPFEADGERFSLIVARRTE